MVVTIDRLGRIVVPKKVRERLHLVPGVNLELKVEHDGIRLRPVDTESALVRKKGVLIHHGSGTLTLDMAEFVNLDRRNRHDQIVAEEPPE
jgi:AbrB family looped-hinge helix DNA binding protein